MLYIFSALRFLFLVVWVCFFCINGICIALHYLCFGNSLKLIEVLFALVLLNIKNKKWSLFS
jgi:hypothetical protein